MQKKISAGSQRFFQIFWIIILGFALRYHVVRYGIVRAMRLVDGTKVVLVFAHILGQRHEKTFGMNGGHYYALTHCGALFAWQSLCKVENELGRGMGYQGKVAIGALRDLVVDAEVDILGLLFLWHGGWFLGRTGRTCRTGRTGQTSRTGPTVF